MTRLVTSTNSGRAERAVRSAAARDFGRGRMHAFYEHGQWWVEDKRTGAQFSAHDQSPGSIGFEQVSRGDDE